MLFYGYNLIETAFFARLRFGQRMPSGGRPPCLAEVTLRRTVILEEKALTSPKKAMLMAVDSPTQILLML